MTTVTAAGLSPILQQVVDAFTKFLGDSGSGNFTLKPDKAPASTVKFDVGNGASLALPAGLDIKYSKAGDQLTFNFVQQPSAIYKGISVPIKQVNMDLTQVHVSFGGMIGAFTSLTIKAGS